MNTMMHRDFAARVEYSEEDGCFVGHITGIRDVIGFHGKSVAELRKCFKEAVDDYLKTCEKLGQEPNARTLDNSACDWPLSFMHVQLWPQNRKGKA